MAQPLPEKLIKVERREFLLTLHARPEGAWEFHPVRRYDVAVGAIDYRTDPGVFVITGKSNKPEWRVPDSQWAIDLGLNPGEVYDFENPANPIKARWMTVGPSGRGVGIHGTNQDDSIGTRASHGCIRMRPADIIDLYDKVPMGTVVVID